MCLALAGAVGIIPELHRLLEHGGQGPAHTHRADWAEGASHPHPHRHPARATENNGSGPESDALVSSVSRPSVRLLSHPHEFTLPSLPLREIWNAFVHALSTSEADGPASSPERGLPGHHHQGLVQMLVGGLLDQPMEWPSLVSLPLPSIGHAFPPRIAPFSAPWSPQNPSRGPPFLEGPTRSRPFEA